MNDEGAVAGVSATTGSTNLNPFIWTESGGMVDLNSTIVNMPSSWTPTSANLINNNGLIAGIGYPDLATYPPSGTQHAFCSPVARSRKSPTPAGRAGEASSPRDSTRAAKSSRFYFDSQGDSQSDQHAFEYTAALGTREILGLSGTGAIAEGVNDLDQIVGGTTLPDGSECAFLYTDAGGMIDLDPLAPVNGWTLVDAIGINDAGQIVAEGLNASGDPHAFLLTPTPEPPTIAILVSFALIIIFIRYYGVARGRARRRATPPRSGKRQGAEHGSYFHGPGSLRFSVSRATGARGFYIRRVRSCEITRTDCDRVKSLRGCAGFNGGLARLRECVCTEVDRWLNSFFAQRRKHVRRAVETYHVLAIEPLEPRRCLSTLTFAGGNNGIWNNDQHNADWNGPGGLQPWEAGDIAKFDSSAVRSP